MIARRMRRYTALRARLIERKDRVCCAARFERADLLKIFTFKKHRRPTRLVESLAGQHRRAMNVCTNLLVRRANFIELDCDRLTRRWHLGFGHAPGAGRFRPGELEFGAGWENS